MAKKLKDCFPMIREENELLSLLQSFLFRLTFSSRSITIKGSGTDGMPGCFYEEIYRLCRNVEDIMEMFSRELQELESGKN